MAVFLVPYLLCLLALANKVDSQDRTTFTFDSFPAAPTDLIYEGEAHVRPNSTFLRLTGTYPGTSPYYDDASRVTYASPVQFWEPGRQASFETTIRFLITPRPNIWAADGIAFFIVPVGSRLPPDVRGNTFGFFSFRVDNPTFFAVEFDVFRNSMDPDFPHIGIDVNSLTSRDYARSDGMVGQMVTARINYEATTRNITVVVYGGGGAETARMSHVLDLKTVVSQQVQVGISSSTGSEGVALHDIYSWYFTSTLVRENNNNNNIQQVV